MTMSDTTKAVTKGASTDRIEKTVLLKADKARVWRALTNAEEFGAWFRAKLDCGFEVGKHVTGRITYPGYEHLKLDVNVEKMDAERLFSFRWKPGAIDPNKDYSSEPSTLVEFRLADEAGGTRLTVTESGFDKLPAERRNEAFRLNNHGWDAQIENISKHVAG